MIKSFYQRFKPKVNIFIFIINPIHSLANYSVPYEET